MSTPAAGGAASRLALKQTPLDTWSTREHLALASAVLRSGDQNWMSVSRAMRGFADRGRPPDWFSQKNCAQQYARLLELVDTPRRKRERGETNDTPGESIARKLRQDRTDELRRQVTETRAAYTALKAQIRQLRSGQLDAKLDEIQREIQAEKEAAAQEQERQRQWLADREAQKLAVQQALRAQVTKAPPPKRRKMALDRRESSPSEAGSVLSEADFADSPASEAQPAEASGDETSRDAAEQRPAPASPLLTSLLRSPSGGRPVAVAVAAAATATGAASEPGASGPPAGSPTLSRLLELPPGTPGHSLPRLNLFPEQKPEQNGETVVVVTTVATTAAETGAGEQKAVQEVKQERGETEMAEETPAPPPPPPPPAAEQPEPPAQPAVAAEMEVKSESPAEEVDTAKEEPAESADGAAVQPAVEPAPAPAAAPTAIADTTMAAAAEVDIDTNAAASAVTEEEPVAAAEPAQDPSAGKKPAAAESETGPLSADVESKPASESAPTEVKTEPEPEPKSKLASEPAEAEAAAPQEPAAVASEVRAADGGGGGDAPAALSEPATAVVKQEPVEEEEESETPARPPSTAASPAKEATPAAEEAAPLPPPPPLKEEREESDAESAASVGPIRRARSASARSEPASQESVPNSPASAVLSGDDEERRDYKLWKKSILLLWREFAAHRHASMFARPITNDQVSNYRAVVKSPMDLAQLKRSVETGAVSTTPQFQRDLMLMFCNAMMFNATDHQVYRFAREMQTESVEKLQLLMQGDQQAGAASKRRETRESSRDELKRKRSGDDRPVPTRKRR